LPITTCPLGASAAASVVAFSALRSVGLRRGRLLAAGDACLLHQPGDGVGELRALVAPMLHPIECETKTLFILTGNRIVEAEALDEPSIAAIARIGHDDIEERSLFRAAARESDDNHG
jgi:hypothetical protein